MNIQKVIKKKGFTIAQVAAKMKNQRGGIGISQGALSTALNGNPTIDKLKEIANILGIPLSELVADSDTDSLTAFLEYNGRLHSARSLQELKDLVAEIEKSRNEE